MAVLKLLLAWVGLWLLSSIVIRVSAHLQFEAEKKRLRQKVAAAEDKVRFEQAKPVDGERIWSS